MDREAIITKVNTETSSSGTEVTALCRDKLDWIQDDICSRYDFSWLKDYGYINTIPIYDTGHVLLSQDGTTVTGSFTTWTTDMAGRLIKFGTEDEYYEISTASTSSITLANTYAGTTLDRERVEILRPNAVGFGGFELTNNAGTSTANDTYIDEVTTNDSDYVENASADSTSADYYELADTVATYGTISKVTVKAKVKFSTNCDYARLGISGTDGTPSEGVFSGNLQLPELNTWGTIEYSWATASQFSPVQNWSTANLADLEAILEFTTGGGGNAKCSQLWVEVTYGCIPNDYDIYKTDYSLASDFKKLIWVKQLITPQKMVNIPEVPMTQYFPDMFIRGDDAILDGYTLTGTDSSGYYTIRFSPVQTTRKQIYYQYIKQLATINTTGAISKIPTKWHDAFVFRLNAFVFDMIDIPAKAGKNEAYYEQTIQRMIDEDNKRDKSLSYVMANERLSGGRNNFVRFDPTHFQNR